MVHNTIDSIEVCILHTLMHDLYIKKTIILHPCLKLIYHKTNIVKCFQRCAYKSNNFSVYTNHDKRR